MGKAHGKKADKGILYSYHVYNSGAVPAELLYLTFEWGIKELAHRRGKDNEMLCRVICVFFCITILNITHLKTTYFRFFFKARKW